MLALIVRYYFLKLNEFFLVDFIKLNNFFPLLSSVDALFFDLLVFWGFSSAFEFSFNKIPFELIKGLFFDLFRFYIAHKKNIKINSKFFKIEFRNFFFSYSNFTLQTYESSRSLAVRARTFYNFARYRSGFYFLKLNDWAKYFSEKIENFKFVGFFFLKKRTPTNLKFSIKRRYINFYHFIFYKNYKIIKMRLPYLKKINFKFTSYNSVFSLFKISHLFSFFYFFRSLFYYDEENNFCYFKPRVYLLDFKTIALKIDRGCFSNKIIFQKPLSRVRYLANLKNYKPLLPFYKKFKKNNFFFFKLFRKIKGKKFLDCCFHLNKNN